MLSKEFFESVYKMNNKETLNESIIRTYEFYCKDCRREYTGPSKEPAPCPCCGKVNDNCYVHEVHWG